VLDEIRASDKPVVVTFLGGDPAAIRAAGAHPATAFDDAAILAASLAEGRPPRDIAHAQGFTDEAALDAMAAAAARGLAPGAAILGLYSGGSLAGEAKLVLRSALGPERHDTILDLGDDEFTVGRPHPMIDPRLRNERIVAAGQDPSIGVLLLDVVLGYGSHADPAGALIPAIREALEHARAAGREIRVVASVVGTDEDPQGLARQEALLEGAGVALEPSNARAARLAAAIVAAAAAPSPAGVVA
jgi:hypothetical protein